MTGYDGNPTLKITYAWNYRDWGGAQIYFLGLARRLRGKCQIRFIFPEATSSDFTRMLDAEELSYSLLKHSVDTKPIKGTLAKIRMRAKKLRSEFEMVHMILQSGCDIAHVDIGPWYSPGALFFLASRMTTFYTIHNRMPDIGLFRSSLFRLKFALAALLPRLRPVVTNLDAADSMRRYADETFFSRLTVAPTNVDPDEIRSVESNPGTRRVARERLQISEAELLVLTVGQFIERKGRGVLSQAATLLAEHPNLRFRWVTASQLSDSDRWFAESCAVGGRFEVLTMTELGLDRRKLLETVAAADIFVLPSLVEGLPIALMEAMALGVPVVATQINAVPEAVRNGVNGFLVQPGDAVALAEAFERLADDAPLRIRIGNEARMILESGLTEPVVAGIIWNAYLDAHQTHGF